MESQLTVYATDSFDKAKRISDLELRLPGTTSYDEGVNSGRFEKMIIGGVECAYSKNELLTAGRNGLKIAVSPKEAQSLAESFGIEVTYLDQDIERARVLH